jgi:large subunit ribosomal protein L25
MKLAVQARSVFGKKLTPLRKQKLVPGVVYSKHLSETIAVSIDEVALKKAYAYAGSSTALELEGDGIKQLVLFHDYHLDPVTDRFLHVDFLAVKADEVVEAEVHIIFEGEAPIVKLNQGQLQFVKHTIMVEALPMDLPHDIKVDISNITTLDDGVFVRNLDLGKKVKILEDGDQPIVVAVELSEEESSDAATSEASA